MDDLTLTCSCRHLRHAARFSVHPVGAHDEDEMFEAYIEVSLHFEDSWWGRLRTALRYFFRRTCGYGDVSEFLVHDQDLPKLQAWLDQAKLHADDRMRRSQKIS